jgi:hypothetical protein
MKGLTQGERQLWKKYFNLEHEKEKVQAIKLEAQATMFKEMNEASSIALAEMKEEAKILMADLCMDPLGDEWYMMYRECIDGGDGCQCIGHVRRHLHCRRRWRSRRSWRWRHHLVDVFMNLMVVRNRALMMIWWSEVAPNFYF